MGETIAEKRQFNLMALERTSPVAPTIPTKEQSWNNLRYSFVRDRFKRYSLEEIKGIIDSGSINAQIDLSRDFLAKNGFYKQTILYYATHPSY